MKSIKVGVPLNVSIDATVNRQMASTYETNGRLDDLTLRSHPEFKKKTRFKSRKQQFCALQTNEISFRIYFQ